MLSDLKTLHELIKTLGENNRKLRSKLESLRSEDTVPRGDWESEREQQRKVSRELEQANQELLAHKQRIRMLEAELSAKRQSVVNLDQQVQALEDKNEQLSVKLQINLERDKAIMNRLKSIEDS